MNLSCQENLDEEEEGARGGGHSSGGGGDEHQSAPIPPLVSPGASSSTDDDELRRFHELYNQNDAEIKKLKDDAKWALEELDHIREMLTPAPTAASATAASFSASGEHIQ